MPIKPENKNRYPANWKEIREAVRKRAGDRCEWCGVPNRRYAFRFAPAKWMYRLDWPTIDETDWVSVLIVCTTAHVHDKRPENCDIDNLAFLCQRCHLDHDRND